MIDLPQMREPLVTIPSTGDGLEDSGEGGLFVIMVVPEPENWSNECHVDVHAMLTHPNVCLSAARSDLWEPYDYKQSCGHLYRKLSDLDMQEEAQWVLRASAPQDFSVPMLASVLLGSTMQSLWSEREGGYWVAGHDDLTVKGRMLSGILKSTYDVEPLILTFLDT